MKAALQVQTCLTPSFVFQVELKEYIKVENEIYEVQNDRIGRNEEIPLKRSRKVKHKVPTYSISSWVNGFIR